MNESTTASSFNTRSAAYVPQRDDPVVLTLTLPATTEEWADDELRAPFLNFDRVERDNEGRLVVTQTIGGNCNAVANARQFLDDVEEALRECEVDPMLFDLHAEAIRRATT